MTQGFMRLSFGCLLVAGTVAAEPTPVMDATAHFRRGQVLVEKNMGDHPNRSRQGIEEGIAQLSRALELGYPNSIGAYKELVHAYQQLAWDFLKRDAAGQKAALAESKEVCRKLLRLAPEDAEALRRCALSFRDDAEQQLSLYRRLVQVAPKEPEGHYRFGLILIESGRLVEGAQEVREAINLEQRTLSIVNYVSRLVDRLNRRGCTGTVVEPPPAEILVEGYPEPEREAQAQREYKQRVNRMLDSLDCLRRQGARGKSSPGVRVNTPTRHRKASPGSR